MFGAIIPPVFVSACPVVFKLTLGFSASDPVEAVIHCLEFSRSNIIIYHTCSGRVVFLEGGFWMWTFHFLQNLSHRHHFLRCYEHCT